MAGLPAPQRRALEAALLIEEPKGGRLDRRAVCTAFLNALRGIEGPVALVVDDVHWLDPETSEALEFAARRLRASPCALLLARRAEEGEAVPLGLERALSPEGVHRTWVGPLSLGAVHELLHTRLGLVLPRPRLRRLHELSGGNPFYALELGRALQRGSIALDPGEELPATLQDFVRERIADLPDETRTALATAAALSRPSLALVDAGALEPAVQAQVVEVDGEDVRFAHPLLRTAAYALVGPAERRELHRRLADRVSEVEERARHLALAAEDPDDHVAELIEDGAAAAFQRGAPESAAELAGQAVRLTAAPAEARRRALLEAEYRFEAGDAGAAAALLEAELAHTAPGRERARLLSRLARIRHFAEGVQPSVELLREALSEAGDDPALRTEIEEGLAWGLLLMRTDLHAALGHARSAVAFAERLGDRASLAEALAVQGLVEFTLGGDPTEPMERALALEESTSHLRVLRHPSFAYAYYLSRTDELDRAREILLDLHRRALEHGDESALPPILNDLARVECLTGQWAAAVAHAEEGLSLAFQNAQRPTAASLLSTISLLAALQGRVDEAREHAFEALELAGAEKAEDAPARGGQVAIRSLGFLELSLGNAEAAEAYLGPFTRALLAAGIREPGEVRSLPDEIEALVALGRHDEAEAFLAELEAMAHSTGRRYACAAAARCRGLLLAETGDMATALAELKRAAALSETVSMPFEQARTLLALGQVQRRGKQRKAARDTLEKSLAIFVGLGASLWVERARTELTRIGGRRPGNGDLTETERQLAALVAEGRSNKEAAAALFVTPKTVETRLSRIYGKLGIHSRGELSRRVLEHKL